LAEKSKTPKSPELGMTPAQAFGDAIKHRVEAEALLSLIVIGRSVSEECVGSSRHRCPGAPIVFRLNSFQSNVNT
jgi:hypothetical protein